jgi:carboxymethylenebutenolidase
VHEIKEAMDTRLEEGMQTFDQSLYTLYKEGKIELEEALNKADSRDGLALKFRLAEGGDPSAAHHDPFDPTRVTAEGPERDRFKAMIRSITDTMVMRDTAAVIEMIDAHPSARQGLIGVVGYCMGGGFALSAAGMFPERVAAALSFHGGSLATDKPDSAHLLARRMRARVYVGVAEIDPTFSPEQQHRLETALSQAGVEHTIETYKGARHGFAVTGHLVYDRDSSERHWQRLLQLLRETLKES